MPPSDVRSAPAVPCLPAVLLGEIGKEVGHSVLRHRVPSLSPQLSALGESYGVCALPFKLPDFGRRVAVMPR